MLFLLFISAVCSNIPRLANDEFSKKVVLVTGGSSGIGYATALEFARHGAKVVIASRDSTPRNYNGSSAVQKILADSEVVAAGGSARWVKTDVVNRLSVKALIANILANEGTLDIAINNAGISGPVGKINAIGDYIGSEYDPVINNLVGTANCLTEETQYFVDQNKNGTIVNTASVNGVVGYEIINSLYCASKFGVVGLTRSVAREFLIGPPSIRVNAVAPGVVNTPFIWNWAKAVLSSNGQQPWEGEFVTEDSELWKNFEPNLASMLRGGTLIQPPEQAYMILFLASDRASFITGAVYNVDNGELA